MHFNAYPVTPDMGLRESINAMLSHVAYNGRDFGYLPSIAHESNFIALQDTWGDLLVSDGDTLTLAPVITDSSFLAVLVDDLLSLCNEYPVYDEQLYSEIEYQRTLEAINDMRAENTTIAPCSDCIARQLFEDGAYIEQSEYGAFIPESDFDNAVVNATCEH